MVKYTCPTCSKEFNRKSSFTDHTQNKKKPCKPFNNNIYQKIPILTNFDQEISVKNEKKENKCTHCDRTFTTIYTLNRHLNGRCKNLKDKTDKTDTELKEVKKENAQLKHEVEELKKMFFEFSKQNNKRSNKNKNITNNTLNNNNNTNIQTQNNNTQNINIILPYGKELENIKLNEVLDHMVVRDFDNMLPKLVKYIYLNKDKPQNQNFVVNDIARNKCQYYDGEKWITGKANDQILKLFENTNSLLTDPFDRPELEKTLKFINDNKKYQTRINTILENKTFAKSLFDEAEKENLDKRQEILDELKLIFYSHKDEILKICV